MIIGYFVTCVEIIKVNKKLNTLPEITFMQSCSTEYVRIKEWVNYLGSEGENIGPSLFGSSHGDCYIRAS
jgi:hypothetical protein